MVGRANQESSKGKADFATLVPGVGTFHATAAEVGSQPGQTTGSLNIPGMSLSSSEIANPVQRGTDTRHSLPPILPKRNSTPDIPADLPQMANSSMNDSLRHPNIVADDTGTVLSSAIESVATVPKLKEIPVHPLAEQKGDKCATSRTEKSVTFSQDVPDPEELEARHQIIKEDQNDTSSNSLQAIGYGNADGLVQTSEDIANQNRQSSSEEIDGLQGKSLLLLSSNSKIRKFFLALTENKAFETLILLIVILNTVLLALEDPSNSDERLNKFLASIDIAFTIVFFAEMCMKIIARGFAFGKNTYLADSWNRLDFIVVVLGLYSSILQFTGGSGTNLSGVRALRVLKALRTINGVAGLRVLIESLFSSAVLLINTMIVVTFSFLIFAIVGIHLFNGDLHSRCFLPSGSVASSDFLCGAGGRTCPDGQVCSRAISNARYFSFDNLGAGFLAVFQCLTLENWSQTMYMVNDVTRGFAIVFYIIVVYFLSLFLINLSLAIMKNNFSVAQSRMKRLEAKKSGESNLMIQIKRSFDCVLNVFTRGKSKVQPASNLSTDSSNKRKQFARFIKSSVDHVRKIIESKEFNVFFMCLIVLNTAVLGADHHGIDDHSANIFETINLVLTYVFAVEVALKMVVMGLKDFTSDKFNIFDAVIVAVSFIELLVAGSGTLSALRALRILRLFRVLRVFKFLRHLNELHKLTKVIVRSMESFTYIAMLLFLFIAIYSILGMQLFGSKFHFKNREKPRRHFDTFFDAFLSIFQTLTLEGWDSIMFDAIEASSAWAFLFFVSWIMFGVYILLNLFLAIILDNFENQYEETKKKSQKKWSELKARWGGVSAILGKSVSMQKLQKQVKRAKSFEIRKKVPWTWPWIVTMYNIHWAPKPLFLIPVHSRLRKHLLDTVEADWFTRSILILICMNSLALAIEYPSMDSDSTLAYILKYFDYAFTALFAMEFLLKVMAHGFIIGEKSYLRNGWNVLDFFIVVSSLVSVFLSSVNLEVLRSLRALRTLRPLRAIHRIPDLKSVVVALFASVKGISNVLIISLMIWLIFGILGVQLLKGTFFRCNDNSSLIKFKDDCVGQFIGENGHLESREWQNAPFNFDNIGNSLISLFVVSTLESWPTIMHSAMDAVGVDQQPKRDHVPARALFFVSFIVIGSFLFINLFVGVVFVEFKRSRSSSNRRSKHEEDLKLRAKIASSVIISTKKSQKELPIVRKDSIRKLSFRQRVAKIVTDSRFDNFIVGLIGVNVILMTLTWYKEPSLVTQITESLNIAFTVIFALESLLKIFALRTEYFKDSWNRFDFIIVLGSIIDVSLTFLNASYLRVLRVGRVVARLMRAMRISRMMRMTKILAGMASLLETIFRSITAVANVGALLLLLLYVFAVLGVNLFGSSSHGDYINSHSNFEHFGQALLILFRVLTGEEWPDLMTELKSQHGSIAVVYFLLFIALGNFLLLNLCAAIVIETFVHLSAHNAEDVEINIQNAPSKPPALETGSEKQGHASS